MKHGRPFRAIDAECHGLNFVSCLSFLFFRGSLCHGLTGKCYALTKTQVSLTIVRPWFYLLCFGWGRGFGDPGNPQAGGGDPPNGTKICPGPQGPPDRRSSPEPPQHLSTIISVGYLVHVWGPGPQNLGPRSGRPRESLQKGGELRPHIFIGFRGPPGPARPRNDFGSENPPGPQTGSLPQN